MSLTPPLPQPSVSALAIDPLSILLPGEVYVKLTLPDPPPFELVQTQVAQQLAALSPGERVQMLTRVRALRSYLGALEQELAAPA